MKFINPAFTDDEEKRGFRHILQYFIDIATKNNLEDHPATKILLKCHQVASCKDHLEVIEMRKRIQRESIPSLVSLSPEQKYREWTFKAYPLHSLFDALALIYTLGIDETKIERDGELYLLQLRLIARALLATGYITRKGIPSTVAGSWQVSDEAPLRISFAFSCVGGTLENDRKEENQSRRKYCDFLYSVRKVIKLTSGEKKQANSSENCPEFLNWPMVCRNAGIYRTLCLNIPKEKLMKCCRACMETAEGAKSKGIEIQDIFGSCTLVDGNIMVEDNKGGYTVCQLKNMEQIIGVRRGRKVLRK